MSRIPIWDGQDLLQLLALSPAQGRGADRFVNRCGDANAHGRAYGGQILAQALMAAAATVDPARPPTMRQFLFLQGTVPEQAIDYEVTRLQDGKRLSSRHVRGRLVLDAQLTFARPRPVGGAGARPARRTGGQRNPVMPDGAASGWQLKAAVLAARQCRPCPAIPTAPCA